MIELYGYWRSTAAYRVRIALNLLNIEYQSISVHLVKDGGEQHQPMYDALNPAHLVPALVDGDLELTQSLAIIEYLDERYGQYTLVPQDVADKAMVRSMSQDIACDIHPINNLRVVQHLADMASFDAHDKVNWMRHWMKKGFDSLERRVGDFNQPFCFGEQPSMADICLVAQLYNARRFELDLSPYPKLIDIEQRCLAIEAFTTAAPEQQHDANT